MIISGSDLIVWICLIYLLDIRTNDFYIFLFHHQIYYDSVAAVSTVQTYLHLGPSDSFAVVPDAAASSHRSPWM